jgi:hypothetical protein
MDERMSGLIDTVHELILNLVKRIDDISNEYDNGGNYVSERLINLFDDLNTLAEGIDVIRESYPGLDLTEFQEKADMIAQALEAQDMMLLFDILRYELKDLLLYWDGCLTKIN